MHKKILGLLVIICGALQGVQAQQADFDSHSSQLVQRYCVTCHNEQLKTAGLLLDQAITQPVAMGPATWEKVVRRLRARSMPPQGMPRPSDEDYRLIIGRLEAELDQNALDNPDPGRTVPHRLNRAEYANAIRDILGLEIEVDELLPNDPASGHGFDNIADVLTLSPLLMERYISAAKIISRLAIGDPDQANVLKTYLLPDNLDQDERISEDLPFASRGGTAISHYFPADGEYAIRVRMKSIDVGIYAGKIVGFTKQKRIEIRLDGELLEQFSVGAGQDTDEHLIVRAPVKAGMHSVGISFQRDRTKAELIRKDRLDGSTGDGAVSLVEIEGPFNMSGVGDTISRRKIFSCYPARSSEEKACASEILGNLAHLAYRRPLLQNDLFHFINLDANKETLILQSAWQFRGS